MEFRIQTILLLKKPTNKEKTLEDRPGGSSIWDAETRGSLESKTGMITQSSRITRAT